MFDASRRFFWSSNCAVLLIANLLLALTLTASSHSAYADGWVVVFEDDFSTSKLDTAQWYTRFIYDNGTMDHFNNEVERYRESGNHLMKNGVLNLTAKQ